MIGGFIGKAIGAVARVDQIISATATASGIGAANADGRAVILASATAAGVGAASAVGAGIKLATSSTAAGLGAANGVGGKIVSGQGSAAGVGASNATGICLATVTASAAGVGAASAGGAKFGTAIASAPGVGAASATSQVVKPAQASASGVGAASGIGGLIAAFIGAATGQGNAYGAGSSYVPVWLRPDGDSVTDGWTDQTGGTTNIYQAIDEIVASDADFVQSPAAISDGVLKVRLYEGPTQIVEWTHSSLADTFTSAEQTLTDPQVEAIGNFANLFVELDDNSGNVYRFPISNPPGDIQSPVKLRYRYKKLAA